MAQDQAEGRVLHVDRDGLRVERGWRLGRFAAAGRRWGCGSCGQLSAFTDLTPRAAHPFAPRWKTAEQRLMDHAEVIAGGREARHGRPSAGRLQEVVDEFMRLPRRLVVIGEPYAAKTGVLLLLTLGLLARRTPADPVPVLFSLAFLVPPTTGFRIPLTAEFNTVAL